MHDWSSLTAWIHPSHAITHPERDRATSGKPLAGALAVLLGALATLVGCSGEPANDDMVLDLDTLTAETEVGTLQAWRLDDTFVESLGEGQAIGVARLDDIEGRSPGEIAVYIYDRQRLAVLVGSVDEDGAATLQSGDLADFEATVDLVIDADGVSGTASFLEQSIPFDAPAASDVGGVYWAEGTDQEPDVRADWVVLPDERQWGCICAPPGFSPCCQMQR